MRALSDDSQDRKLIEGWAPDEKALSPRQAASRPTQPPPKPSDSAQRPAETKGTASRANDMIVEVSNDELFTVRDAMRELNRIVDRLQDREIRHAVLMRRGKMVAEITVIGE